MTPATLRSFAEEHPRAVKPLRSWVRIVQKSRFADLSELRQVFPSADLAKAKDGTVLTIFNIGGNNYRLITVISYRSQRVYVREIMTHHDYDRWNDEGRPT